VKNCDKVGCYLSRFPGLLDLIPKLKLPGGKFPVKDDDETF